MQICWRCNGEGEIYQPGYVPDTYLRCDECNGKGELPPEPIDEGFEDWEDRQRRKQQERNEY